MKFSSKKHFCAQISLVQAKRNFLAAVVELLNFFLFSSQKMGLGIPEDFGCRPGVMTTYSVILFSFLLSPTKTWCIRKNKNIGTRIVAFFWFEQQKTRRLVEFIQNQ